MMALAGSIICAVSLHAQVVAPQPLELVDRPPRVQARGLALSPAINLTNFGVDTNVFNSVDNPKSDSTFTVSPSMDLWLRAGRMRLAMRGQADVVYFARFASERSIDGGTAAKLTVPLNRLTPYVDLGVFSGRQRLNQEIDVRSRRKFDSLGLGASYPPR
jgi:hypothetical protein